MQSKPNKTAPILKIVATDSQVSRPSKLNEIIGQEPVYMKLNVHSLVVDERYQRPKNIARARKIAREWNWNAFRAPSVARRPDGSMAAYDGQHTVLAAMIRKIDMIPCMVRDVFDVADEAQAFLDGNNNQTKPSSLQRFRAAAVAGAPQQMAVQVVCDEFGVTIRESVYSPFNSPSVSTFESIVGKKPTDRTKNELRLFIATIFSCWPEDDRRLAGRFQQAVKRFSDACVKKGIDPSAALRRVALAASATEIFNEGERMAKTLGKTSNRVMTDHMVDLHDRKLRMENRIGKDVVDLVAVNE